MKRIYLYILTLFTCVHASCQVFDEHFSDSTLRLDYIFAGDNKSQHIFFHQAYSMPIWAGRKSRLSEKFLNGNGQITVRDPETGNEIESVVDLSKLKQKEFKLTGDENGHFSYTLPITKKEVKFRFLTRADEKKLLLMQKLETEGMKSSLITEISNNLKTYLDTDDVLSRGEIAEIEKLRGKLDMWAGKLKEQTDVQYLRFITNRLEMQIQAVDGDYDRENIKKFIMNMPAKDSLMLRRYIIDNEPGMDFEIEVERPASLGGGSFKTFLEWDDNVFLNIS